MPNLFPLVEPHTLGIYNGVVPRFSPFNIPIWGFDGKKGVEVRAHRPLSGEIIHYKIEGATLEEIPRAINMNSFAIKAKDMKIHDGVPVLPRLQYRLHVMPDFSPICIPVWAEEIGGNLHLRIYFPLTNEGFSCIVEGASISDMPHPFCDSVINIGEERVKVAC